MLKIRNFSTKLISFFLILSIASLSIGQPAFALQQVPYDYADECTTKATDFDGKRYSCTSTRIDILNSFQSPIRRSVLIAKEHPNVSLLNRLDPDNLAGEADLFAEDFVWHFFNPRLPDVQGDYVGLNGLQAFFEKLAAITDGSFQVEPISAIPFGDELVVVHAKDRMTFESRPIEIDAVVVWRIVDDLIVEAWDIPSVYMEHSQAAA